jgi:glycyl-tRNA synthetase beta chain
MDVDLGRLVARSCDQLSVEEETRARIAEFIQQRTHVQLREKGYGHELTTLALSVAGGRPLQALRFLEVFSALQEEKWFTDLVTSAVRVRNILSKGGEQGEPVDVSLLTKDAENRLHTEITRLDPLVGEALSAQDWKKLAGLLSELSPFVAQFFDDVLVMDPDESIKNNRMRLLKLCNSLFLKVGNIGVLKGA